MRSNSRRARPSTESGSPSSSSWILRNLQPKSLAKMRLLRHLQLVPRPNLMPKQVPQQLPRLRLKPEMSTIESVGEKDLTLIAFKFDDLISFS